ncbi:MAG TPA: DUF5723 family protein [Bacillota bacterium]|nr:DUF5723 family protein [Bacillota bacterium]
MKQKIITVVLCCFGLIFMIPSISLGLGLENPADNAGEPTHFEIVFPELSLQADNNLFNLDFLNADMTTEAKKNSFLGRMEGQTFKSNFNLDLGTEMTIGDLTLHVGLWGGGSINLSSGFNKLLFYGYEPSQTYKFTGTLASSLSALSCDLTYARSIPLEINDLQVGATFRLLEGFAVYSGEVTNGEVTTNFWGQSDYKFNVRSYGTNPDNLESGDFSGQGCLVDLGANYIMDKWKIGLALKNLGPAMEWTGIDVKDEQYTGSIDEIGSTETPEPTTTTTNKTNVDYSVKIPVVLEAGATYSLNPKLDLKAGLRTAFSDGFGYSRTLRLLGDVDWRPFWLMHLAGEVYFQGAQMGASTLTELRLGPLWMSLGVGWTGGLIPGNSTTGVDMSLSGRIHF